MSTDKGHPDSTETGEIQVVGDPRARSNFVEPAPPNIASDQTWIAKALVFTLVGTVLLILLMFAFEKALGLDPRDIRDLGGTLISPIVALLGSVIGFYYGERQRRK